MMNPTQAATELGLKDIMLIHASDNCTEKYKESIKKAVIGIKDGLLVLVSEKGVPVLIKGNRVPDVVYDAECNKTFVRHKTARFSGKNAVKYMASIFIDNTDDTKIKDIEESVKDACYDTKAERYVYNNVTSLIRECVQKGLYENNSGLISNIEPITSVIGMLSGDSIKINKTKSESIHGLIDDLLSLTDNGFIYNNVNGNVTVYRASDIMVVATRKGASLFDGSKLLNGKISKTPEDAFNL